MKGTSLECELIDEECLTFDVADEAIEVAVYGRAGGGVSLTLSFCSSLDTCPA
jgi:hypothetical protein